MERLAVVARHRRVMDSAMGFVTLRLLSGAPLLLTCGALAAHPIDTASSGLAVALPWVFEPWVIVCLVISLCLYGIGLKRLWSQGAPGRGVRIGHAGCFIAGWALLVVALVSPLDSLGGWLFSAHMLQHELMMVLAAPLMVLGRPLAIWTWGLPAAWRPTLRRPIQASVWRGFWRAISAPLFAWMLHAAALWLWHVPKLFEAALMSNAVHTLQHISFLITALLFWWSVLGQSNRRARGAALVYLFTTMLHTGALGALLTLSSFVWYPAYLLASWNFGLEPLEDQQLGGLVMWVPAGLAYLTAGLALGARWIDVSPVRAPAFVSRSEK
jgi:cytochrome c oxidase assembly factor CtaG